MIPVADDLTRALDEANLAPGVRPVSCGEGSDPSPLPSGGAESVARPDLIVSIVDDGEEMTYDLSVEGPWHNFLANGIIVHNSYNEESGRYRELQPVFYVPGE